MKAIYIHVPKEDHKRIKIEAAKRNLTIRDFILSSIERMLGEKLTSERLRGR